MNIKNSSPQNEQILEDRFQMLLSINFSESLHEIDTQFQNTRNRLPMKKHQGRHSFEERGGVRGGRWAVAVGRQ